MTDYAAQVAQQQEAMRLQQEEEARRQEEERKKREAEMRARQQAAAAQQQQSPMAGGFSPASMMSMGGGGATGGASAGGAGGASAGGSAAGGAGSSMASAWPVAVAAVVLAHNQWAKNKGLHDNKDALTGRALYKDSEWYQPRANEKVAGMGDEIRLAALGSSPTDLLKKDNMKEAVKLAAKGGILGSVLKKIF